MEREASPPSPAWRPTGRLDLPLPSTSWGLVAQASGKGEPSAAARNEFAERYYLAVRAYIATRVRDPQQVEDLTQSFFEEAVLEGRLLTQADRQKGRFRSFLKASICNHIVTVHRRNHRKRRASAGPEMRPDALDDGWNVVATEPAPGADEELLRGWARGLVGLAVARVQRLSKENGQSEHFQLFARRYLTDPDNPPKWRDIGAAFGLDEKIARSRASTVAIHFKAILRELVTTDIGSEQDADEEIQALIGLL
jgi:DNA-directed RNA polymerase specialized sigma24 family protein